MAYHFYDGMVTNKENAASNLFDLFSMLNASMSEK